MKLLKAGFLILFCLFATRGFGQMTADPTTWTYEVKKKSGNTYALIYHLSLKEGWHIWSLHPGGDGYQIVPSFNFDKNTNVQLVGKPTETGKKVTTVMEGVTGKITYLQNKVDYIQLVTVIGKTKITGKHGYQVCNENMCLPPKDKSFEFEIR
jgi:hypothetical protein